MPCNNVKIELEQRSFVPPFPYATQIINPFLISMISANHNELEEIFFPLLFLYCKIYFENIEGDLLRNI